jgi:hypothetical protein
MTPFSLEDWLAAWERLRAGQRSPIEISPRQQVRLFEKHVAHVEARSSDLLERLESKSIWIGANMPRSDAIASIRSAVHRLDIAPGESRPFCQAAIGADLALLRAAHELNQAKERFRQFCMNADSQALQLKRSLRRWTKYVYPLQAELCNRPDFDYLRAYQQLHIVSGLPELMTFSEVVARRTSRVSREALLAKLSRKSGAAAVRDYRRVKRASETEFAIDGVTTDSRFVFVRFDGADASGAMRRNIRTNLPVIFRLGRRLPTISYSGDPGVRSFPGRNRPMFTVRKERFLETLPVYRYLAATSRGATSTVR